MGIELSIVRELSLREQKSLIERFVKLSEECGELAQELLIISNASGFQHKTPGRDGIKGEAVDILLVVLSIFFKCGGSEEELKELIEKKCDKWKKLQK